MTSQNIKTLLKCSSEFEEYTQKLDEERKYSHCHYNTPDYYPCYVSSEYDEPNNGFSNCFHSFSQS